MKKEFVAPEMEIESFDVEEVMAFETSFIDPN